jgi:group I intron endonuclease
MSVYKITNNLNGQSYIGQTVNSIHERFRTHCAKYSKGKCPKLWNAIQAHGKDNFKIELLWSKPGCSVEELDAKEREFIEMYNTLSPNGYNLQEGGHGSRHNMESRSKISEAKKKLWLERGDEIRKKVAERGVTEETRQRLSKSCIQKYMDRPELKEFSRNRLGATHTEETRAKMAEAWKRRRERPDYGDIIAKSNSSKCKEVYMFDGNRNLLKKFDSIVNTAKHNSAFTKGGVESAIRSGSLYKKGYYFSYTEVPPPEKQRAFRSIYCFDKEGGLIDVCKTLEEIHEKTGFSASGVLKNAIKGGNLYKGQFYFSYSSTLPLVSTP